MTSDAAAHQIQVHLDELLVKRKMTQVELSEKTGIHAVNISKLKNGHVKGIKFDTLTAICRELDCQPGDLLTYGTD